MLIRMPLLRSASRFGRSLAALALAALSAQTARAEAKTLYFPHQDERLLQPWQKNGGAALLPAGAGPEQRVPLVVFLHGTNSAGDQYLWMGGRKDLRPLARRLVESEQVQPFVLAAPSQTKNAALASRVWKDFDLSQFVEDVVKATEGQVGIDRERVVLAGHSGAGCNPSGGLAGNYWSASTPLPLALISIDPCLDAKMGRAFTQRPSEVPLLLWWQSAVWTREPAKFSAVLMSSKPEGRVDRLVELPPVGANPHNGIVPVALERALRELFPVEQLQAAHSPPND